MLQTLKKRLTGLQWRGNSYRTLVLSLLLMMGLYSLCRIGFYVFNVSFFPDMTAARFGKILFGGLRFDISAILYSNALFIILMILPFPFRFRSFYKTIVKYIFISINSVALAVNVADAVYYKFTLRRTTITVFSEFGHEQNGVGLLFSFLVAYWYAVVVLALLVFVMVWGYNKLTFDGPQLKNRWLFFGSGLAAMAPVIFLFVGGARGGFAHSTRPITLSNAGQYATIPKDINLVLNTPFALMRTANTSVIERATYFSSPSELNKEFTPLHQPHDSAAFRHDNVVIIILESFSKEFVGFYNKNLDSGTYKGYTPFMDSLIGKSKAYQYSLANGRRSIDAMPSVLASIPSIEVPYVLSHYSGNKINSLASLLKEQGYTTAFFHGAPNGSMGFEAFANISGFEHYYGKTEYNNDDDYDGIWGIWDDKFLQFFAKKLNTFHQPFLATLFSVSSHHPYILPSEYEHKFKGGPHIIHRTIEYTDYSLKKFFETSSHMPWFKNTLFVFTADHASAEIHFNEYNNAVGYFSIPIFFYKQEENWSSYQSELVQQIDIMPTVLGYLHYNKPYIAFGHNIFANDPPVVFNYLNNTYQAFMGDYVLLFNGKTSTALYDFRNDTNLEHNLLAKLPKEAAVMELKLKAMIQQYNNRMVDDDLTVEGPQRPAR